jgi:hypothetical protein
VKLSIEEFKGLTFIDIRQIEEVIREPRHSIEFITKTHIYTMYHEQDCCEEVEIEDICGDFEDIINTPIIHAEEAMYKDNEWVNTCSLSTEIATRHLLRGVTIDNNKEEGQHSTWTFYKIDTNKGGITIRWWGSSNGNYCEEISIKKESINAKAH